jgi:hypothetical protein
METGSMKRIAKLVPGARRSVFAIWILIGAWVLATGAEAQQVRKQKSDRDWSHRLSPEIRQIVSKQRAKRSNNKNGESETPVRPTPATPRKRNLLKLYPPDQIIVAEVGGVYILTRRELERMTIARHGRLDLGGLDVNTTRMREAGHGTDWEQWRIALKRQNRYRESMNRILDEWALAKTLVLLARKANFQVTPAEVDAQLAEARQAYGGDNLDSDLARASVFVGLDPAQMRREISDGILIDKYIMREISMSFTENDLRQIYNQRQARYVTPVQFHGWQIVRHLDAKMSTREKKDLRAEFYRLRRRLAKSGEEKGGLFGLLGGKPDESGATAEELFKEIARRESDDKRTRQQGGDLGWIPLVAGALSDPLLVEFERLEIGAISRIVETDTGLYILRVSERRAPTGATFDAVAHKRVLDDLVGNFKAEIGPQIMRAAPLSVHINSSGLWLLGQGKPKKTKSSRSLPNSLFSEFPE